MTDVQATGAWGKDTPALLTVTPSAEKSIHGYALDMNSGRSREEAETIVAFLRDNLPSATMAHIRRALNR